MTGRFIIVLGMAHSGTTILTKTLSQCPDIFLFRNGTNWHLLENDYLWDANPKVKTLSSPTRYILLKRPWMEERWDFFKEHLPDAHYLITLKTLEQQMRSWSKPRSLVEDELKTNSDVQRARYAHCLRCATEFPLPKRIIHYNDLLNKPQEVFRELSNELDLNFTFNVRDIERYRERFI